MGRWVERVFYFSRSARFARFTSDERIVPLPDGEKFALHSPEWSITSEKYVSFESKFLFITHINIIININIIIIDNNINIIIFPNNNIINMNIIIIIINIFTVNFIQQMIKKTTI